MSGIKNMKLHARVAQSVEHGTLNPRVVRSSPTSGAISFVFLETTATTTMPANQNVNFWLGTKKHCHYTEM